jgi:hypothetical protein
MSYKIGKQAIRYNCFDYIKKRLTHAPRALGRQRHPHHRSQHWIFHACECESYSDRRRRRFVGSFNETQNSIGHSTRRFQPCYQEASAFVFVYDAKLLLMGRWARYLYLCPTTATSCSARLRCALFDRHGHSFQWISLPPPASTTGHLWNAVMFAAATIYQLQPRVRTCLAPLLFKNV